MKNTIKSILAVAMLFGAVSGFAHSGSGYSSVIVFGDSLSDNGNYYRLVDGLSARVPQDGSPPLPYFFGRYSNGPVAVELLAQNLDVPLDDHAVGGALSGLGNEDPRFPRAGVLGQVQDYVARQRRLDRDALYVVWGGANDFLGASSLGDPAVAQSIIADAVANLAQSVTLLYAHGARHFLVPNLPDLGLIPLEQGSAAAPATALSFAFNQALAQALQGLAVELPRADVHTFDVAALLDSVAQNPATYGFLDVSDACVADTTHVCVLTSFNGGPAAGFLFWDDVHPTAAAHALLAAQFLDAVTPTGAAPAPGHREPDWLQRLRGRHAH
jgi:cholinesterase